MLTKTVVYRDAITDEIAAQPCDSRRAMVPERSEMEVFGADRLVCRACYADAALCQMCEKVVSVGNSPSAGDRPVCQCCHDAH